MCRSVCLSACDRYGVINFDPVVGSRTNFQGQRNSSQVIFGRAWVTQIPGPLGLGPKGGFCQIYLLPGFWGRRGGGHTFSEMGGRGKIILGGEF